MWSYFSFSNFSAWILLRRILDEKSYLQPELPYDIVNWITNESRQEANGTVPKTIDEIENEIRKFKSRLEEQENNQKSTESRVSIRGWKKWDGDWSPRPIGV